MRRLGRNGLPLALLMASLLIVAPTAEATLIETFSFSAPVISVVGTPFGITATVGDLVFGSFSYDLNTVPSRMITNNAVFPMAILNGFTLTLGGVTISSSQYELDSVDGVSNFGGSDIFRAVADNDIGDFNVNGSPAIGSAEIALIDIDETLFSRVPPTFKTLPTLSQLSQHADFVFGGFFQDTNNSIVFSTQPAPIPEPGTLLLLGSGMAGLGAVTRRRRQK